MTEKINIAEILKDCPKGMELDCTMYDNVTLIQVREDNIYPIKIETPDGSTVLTKYGGVSYNKLSKCIIFPKGETNWEGFQCPFKDGDIVISNHGDIHINRDNLSSYCCKRQNYFDATITTHVKFDRLATEEEKAKLFDAIKANGYKWNPETKTLEKLVEPKFKVGDEIKYKNGKNIDGVEQGVILSITDEVYDVAVTNNMGVYVSIAEQDDWELVPNKFDITTLKPFESRVLVRHNKDNKWCASFFSHIDGNFHSHCYKYVTIAGKSYPMCIPYEGNEHLLGKTEDCDEYFKNW